MKLLQKTSRLYVMWSIPVLVVCGIGFYFLLQRVITWQVDKSLREERRIIISFLHEGSEDMSELYKNLTSSFYLVEIPRSRKIADTYALVHLADEKRKSNYSPYRVLRCSIHVGEKNYELIIQKSLVQSDSLMYSVALLTLLLLVLLMVGFMLVNLSVAQRIWKPFYETLEKLRDFRADNTPRTGFPETGVVEFDQLNEVAGRMTERIQGDFTRQRQFIENVAHELQTPLSIINSNIELLAQNERLSEKEVTMLQVINETASRLAKVNSTLLLLSRIENGQFLSREFVDIRELVEKRVAEYLEQIREKNIQTNLKALKPQLILINPVLADTLVRNLIQNAVRHNKMDGSITIKTGKNHLEVSNTGAKLKEADAGKMFDKFVRGNTGSDSPGTGLGLAIVKQICDTCNYTVSYEHKGFTHTLKVKFGNAEPVN